VSESAQCPKCGARVPPDAPGGLCPRCVSRVALGSRLRYLGDYELLEEVGCGAMGVVYRARQLSLNRVVAVKMLATGQLATREAVQRFHAEAEAAASLQHTGIVAIHEVGEHEGRHYFSMDYIAGPSFAELARDRALPPESAARYVQAIAEAVHYAHQRGILHRDLKPSNILLDPSDHPRITDFGLAKRLLGDSELTVEGQVMGAPSYMPPEQAAGKRGQVGVPSDVYALGAVMYHMLTGRPPLLGETLPETLLQVQTQEPKPPRSLNATIPQDLETICLKCLQKHPAERFASAAALAEDLRRWQAGEPIAARPVSQPEKAWRWCRRNRVAARLVVAIGVLVLAGGVSLFWLAPFYLRFKKQAAQNPAALRSVSKLPASFDPRLFPILYETTDRDLWLCDAWGTNHVQLVATRDCFDPVWSPDGSRILFRRGESEVWTIRANGEGLRRVGLWTELVGQPLWTGSDRFVVYATKRGSDFFYLLQGGLGAEPLREVWHPERTGGPCWGFMYDYCPRQQKLAFIGAESNWTTRNDLYIVDPSTWRWTNIWSDPSDDHEDGSPRWAARTDRIAWTHAVEPGMRPRDHVIGIIDLAKAPPEVRWIGGPSGDLWLQDWTDEDQLLVLDNSGPRRRICLLDDQGVLVRLVHWEQEFLLNRVRWRKYAAPAGKQP
jgi:tRNA A-37 threonylcarbamoyl transferase component Bud32